MISYDDIKSGKVAVPVGGEGLSLAVIQIDGGTQSRAALNDMVVDDYADLIKAGVPFPPIVVFYDGKKHWLADGFHRFHAYQKAGKSKVAADVRQGTRRDAILHSVGANETHGLRRTNDDKRRAVLTLLNDAEWGAKAERWIATTANVSHTFVQKLRTAHLATLPDKPAEREVERGGSTYTMQTANINADREKATVRSERKVEPATSEAMETKAFVPESAELPASYISDAEREADEIQSPFDRVSDQGRALFLARNNLKSSDGERSIAATGSEHHSADHVSPPVRSRMLGSGSASTGGEDVTHAGILKTTDVASQVRQTSLAAREGEKPLHSNSPDGATKQRENVPPQHEVRPGNTSLGTEPQCDTLGVTAGETATEFQAKASEDNGRTSAIEGVPVTGEASRSIVGGDTDEADRDAGNTPTCALTPRDDITVGTNSNPQPTTPPEADKAEAETPPTASAAQFTNPRCQKPETCHLAHSRNECFECNLAWAKRPKDEQVRLWAEAVQAARAA